MTAALPAFDVCGWSGSGKSTLVVKLVRRFTGRGFKVAVIKHDVHGPNADWKGKDSDRFYQAGADAVLIAPGEHFTRRHPSKSFSLEALVKRLDWEYDLIIVEGNKSANFARKVWLQKDAGEECPPAAVGVQRALAPAEDRAGIAGEMVEEWLRQRLQAIHLCAGVLIGGASTRMGQPKHLMRRGNTTWLEHIVATLRPAVQQVVLLGAGGVPPSLAALPRLPDVPDKCGPLAGLLAAMRWRPEASWLFAACDLPRISPPAVAWLLAHRAPGVWAILPRLHAVQPLFALYEFRAKNLLENVQAPSDLAALREVMTPESPAEIAGAWANLNSPTDIARQ